MRVLALVALTCTAPVGCRAGESGARADSSALDAGSSDTGTADLGVVADAASVDASSPDGALPGAVFAGLSLREQYEVPLPGGHLGEVTIHRNVAYVANSWDSFATVALEPDGTIFATLVRPEETPRPRCTTLAIHDASSTMYCSSDESDRVAAYDVRDSEHPVLRDAAALVLGVAGVRDLQVVGNDLFAAQFEHGLTVSAIGPAGELRAAVATAVTGNLRFVSADRGRIVVLSADRGLLLLDGVGAAVTVAHVLPLAGTPQDLSVRGDRAAVALGSEGAVVVDLSGVPSVIARVSPQAVVTGADLDGELLALTTLTGAYLYDLSVAPARLVGYSASGRRDDRSGGVMLSGRFAGGDFLTSDWIFVERFAAERAGHVLELDVPRGLYVPVGAGATFPLRNEGDVALDATVRVGSSVIEVRVAEGETVSVVIEPALLAELVAAPDANLRVTVTSMGGSDGLRVPVAFRPVTTGSPTERPAVGDVFPELLVQAPSGVLGVPVAGRRSLFVFFARDCAAMWPVLEDATYLGLLGALEDGATPFLLTESDVASDGYVARWALGAADVGHHGYLAPPEVVAFNGSEQVYEDRFQLSSLPRAASHPTNYLVGPSGTVEAVDTYYRGAFPLR